MNIFKQQFQIEKDTAKQFALFLGWQEKVKQVVDDVQEIGGEKVVLGQKEIEVDNPQTFQIFIDEQAKLHSMKFISRWANQIKEEELKKHEQLLSEQIIKPLEDNLTTEILN